MLSAMPKNDEVFERLQRIESHLAHLERQYEVLNEVVIEQARTIKKLQMRCQRLTDSVQTTELERIRSTNPRPPHYQ